jgi:hypothetical protein
MNVRYLNQPDLTGRSLEFNKHAASEVIVLFDDGDATSEFICELAIQLPDGEWKPMKQAFADKDIVPDNLNNWFGFPSPEEKSRGYI